MYPEVAVNPTGERVAVVVKQNERKREFLLFMTWIGNCIPYTVELFLPLRDVLQQY